jgi:hypothetical protein
MVPVILSSDKTQVTLFRNKSAYPVYMTIGNIPKTLCKKPSQCTQILLAYLPTTKLEHIQNKAACRRTLANLFHSCLRRILEPLESVGIHGTLMSSGDGVVRQVHPILAVYVGDYPEQVLVTGIKYGECPKCETTHQDLSELDMPSKNRDLQKVLDALALADHDPAEYVRACTEVGIKPINSPFWARLPYANIFHSITPDILHQGHQGLIRHLIAWIKSAYSPAEIDAHCQRLPPNHNTRLFLNGITGLSKVTGKEHDEMCRVLLGILIDLRLPNNYAPNRLIRALRALLDFLYLAQYPIHTTTSLCSLDDVLWCFHTNKAIFVNLGIRKDFNLPKLHSYCHYVRSIKLFGTTDNYNTQYTERLHINYTKDAYRATNTKDEYPQMTRWLERKEKILQHDLYVKWRKSEGPHFKLLPMPSLEME